MAGRARGASRRRPGRGSQRSRASGGMTTSLALTMRPPRWRPAPPWARRGGRRRAAGAGPTRGPVRRAGRARSAPRTGGRARVSASYASAPGELSPSHSAGSLGEIRSASPLRPEAAEADHGGLPEAPHGAEVNPLGRVPGAAPEIDVTGHPEVGECVVQAADPGGHGRVDARRERAAVGGPGLVIAVVHGGDGVGDHLGEDVGEHHHVGRLTSCVRPTASRPRIAEAE